MILGALGYPIIQVDVLPQHTRAILPRTAKSCDQLGAQSPASVVVARPPVQSGPSERPAEPVQRGVPWRPRDADAQGCRGPADAGGRRVGRPAGPVGAGLVP